MEACSTNIVFRIVLLWALLQLESPLPATTSEAGLPNMTAIAAKPPSRRIGPIQFAGFQS
jgi:hypothetical protein